ncbi:MAG: hypothetical protein ACD_76C00094G0028 [uncultured bacterium]|nr:MAG: hypothetical protein ACD_76C00094G0028 [uncultured bacterium]
MIGPQGSGKGTQSFRISQYLGIPVISTGEMLRNELKNSTAIGKKVESYVNAGFLVPDSIVNELVKKRISDQDAVSGYILDGYPRDQEQLEYYLTIDSPTKAIFIDLADEDAYKRLEGRRVCSSCKTNYNVLLMPTKKEGVCDACLGKLESRNDDQIKIMKNRLKVFHEKTKPMIDVVKKLQILIRINGLQSPDKVFEDIIKNI